ncbi:MAG: LEA14-like dessication related protein [Porticoccus sp.]|jgi:LEA14-like dessication related protein
MSAPRAMKSIQVCIFLASVWSLTSCAMFSPSHQQPDVQLTDIEPLSRKGLEQRWAISLNILNPNDAQLKISGFSYHLKIQGHKVVSGVSSGLQPIPAYGQSAIRLEASANLFAGFRAIESLLNSDAGLVEFELETRISSGWWRWPIIVLESGSLDLGQ